MSSVPHHPLYTGGNSLLPPQRRRWLHRAADIACAIGLIVIDVISPFIALVCGLDAAGYQKLVVFDNHRLGMVELEQEQAGLPEYGTVLDNPDFAAVATGMGITGIRVTDPAELEESVRRTFTTPVPVLLDVLTNPDEVAIPARPTVGQGWGIAVAKVKEAVRSHRRTGSH